MTTAMSEQNTHREAAVQQQQAAAQSRNLNAELQVLLSLVVSMSWSPLWTAYRT